MYQKKRNVPFSRSPNEDDLTPVHGRSFHAGAVQIDSGRHIVQRIFRCESTRLILYNSPGEKAPAKYRSGPPIV
jgi:hypothetical protein